MSISGRTLLDEAERRSLKQAMLDFALRALQPPKGGCGMRTGEELAILPQILEKLLD